VATCKDLKIDGINTTKEGKFQNDIEQLDFSGNKLSSINPNTFSMWNVLQLHYFNLSGNNILNITKFTFYGFRKLDILDLSRNNLSWIECEAFDFTPNMSVLRLRSNRVTEICPHTFSALEHLRHLDLSNNMLSSIQPETLRNNSVLEWLSLANNRLTEIHPDSLRLLRHLRHMDLSNNMISSIQPETLHENSELVWLSLANNRLNEIDPRIFQNQIKLSCLYLSGNIIMKIEGAMFYRNRKNGTLVLTSNNASDFRNEIGRNISEINDEAFVGLQNLQYLDLSINNVKNISLTVFHSTLPQTEMIRSEGTCVCLNSSNISFNVGEYHSCNLTSIILRKMELSGLREKSFSISDNCSVKVLNNSGTLINLTGNSHTYECSLSQDIYKGINVTSLNCLSQGDFITKKCNNSEHNDSITTGESLSISINGDVNKTVLIFGIYASSVFVAIVVVLVITHVVGKPEPDEFWWEDKLAKRSY
jgi:Leucine-rich repeat (LRR) protein